MGVGVAPAVSFAISLIAVRKTGSGIEIESTCLSRVSSTRRIVRSRTKTTFFGSDRHTCRSHPEVSYCDCQNLTNIEHGTCRSFSEASDDNEVRPRLTLLWQSVTEKDMYCKQEIEALKVPVFPVCSNGGRECLKGIAVCLPLCMFVGHLSTGSTL